MKCCIYSPLVRLWAPVAGQEVFRWKCSMKTLINSIYQQIWVCFHNFCLEMFLSAPGWEEDFGKGYSSVETQQWFFFSQLCRSIGFYFLLCHHATFWEWPHFWPFQAYSTANVLSLWINRYSMEERTKLQWLGMPSMSSYERQTNNNKISLKEEAFRNPSFGHVMKMHFSCRLRGTSRTICRVGAWVCWIPWLLWCLYPQGLKAALINLLI